MANLGDTPFGGGPPAQGTRLLSTADTRYGGPGLPADDACPARSVTVYLLPAGTLPSP